MAAIVDSSDDAIISKTLDGVITSWNRGAEDIFGYTANEAVGQNISLIIPADRIGEEHDVLARLGRGEKIEHFETERQAKDGRRLSISLTVSPVRNADGQIVGASKVARDITDRSRRRRCSASASSKPRKQSPLATSSCRLRRTSLQSVECAAAAAGRPATRCAGPPGLPAQGVGVRPHQPGDR